MSLLRRVSLAGPLICYGLLPSGRSLKFMIKKISFVLLTAVLFFISSLEKPACAGGGEVITVAAASSFSFALKEIAEAFSRGNHTAVKLVFGSSGILARQIERGAPFDVFISANKIFIDDLVRHGSVSGGSVRAFADGAIVLAMLRGYSNDLRGLEDLTGKDIGRVAIANPLHAPYGRAAVEALKSAGVWEGVRTKLVYGENVRQTLQFVESGNVDAGIIALSVAKREGIRIVPLDRALHKPILQSVAVVGTTVHKNAAEKFIRYLTGDAAISILKKYGFTRP